MANFFHSIKFFLDFIFDFILSHKSYFLTLFIIWFLIYFIFRVFLKYRATLLSLSYSDSSLSDNSSDELSHNVVRIKLAENVQIISDRPFVDGETVSIDDLCVQSDDNDFDSDFSDMELDD